jgi:uncharacterized protein (TIGR02145 family)
MKKLLFALALISSLISCKKETTTPNTNGNTNTTDTTKTSSNDVLISGFDCSGVKITGTLKKGEVASGVSATLTYTGGNAKTYLAKSYTSIGVNGLTASLLAGTLANGEGTLQFLISGTPVTAGTATFSIVFGGKTCAINLTVEELTQSSGINFTSIGTPVGSFQNNITDIDGNTYKTVKIGSQVWMAENLKTVKYNDGTTIPNITDITQWSNLTTGAWAYYNNDAANNAKYGKLYNWYAVSPTTNGSKNVCPAGWHVPTDAEWTVLTDYLGGASIAGGKMKEVGTSNWNNYNKYATNLSLFTALPGGNRAEKFDGNYFNKGDFGYWWSSTDVNSIGAWNRYLRREDGSVDRTELNKNRGFSVRCLKD